MIWKGSKTSMKWHICPPEYGNMFDIYPQTLNINDIFTHQNGGIEIFTNQGSNQLSALGISIRHNGNQWEIKGRINEIFNQHSYPLVNIQKTMERSTIFNR